MGVFLSWGCSLASSAGHPVAFRSHAGRLDTSAGKDWGPTRGTHILTVMGVLELTRMMSASLSISVVSPRRRSESLQQPFGQILRGPASTFSLQVVSLTTSIRVHPLDGITSVLFVRSLLISGCQTWRICPEFTFAANPFAPPVNLPEIYGHRVYCIAVPTAPQ